MRGFVLWPLRTLDMKEFRRRFAGALVFVSANNGILKDTMLVSSRLWRRAVHSPRVSRSGTWGSMMESNGNTAENGITLFDSLLANGWERFNFGYNGPFPPYLRVGIGITFDGFVLQFQSFIRDRFLIARTSVAMTAHLRSFREIKFTEEACEDAFGRDWAGNNGFPAGRWLQLRQFSVQERLVWDPIDQRLVNVPLELLPMAGQIFLR